MHWKDGERPERRKGMRSVWQDRIDEIRAELEDDPPNESDYGKVERIRGCLLDLVAHVENLSKLLDKVGRQR